MSIRPRAMMAAALLLAACSQAPKPAPVAPPVQVPEPPPLAEALPPAPDQNLVTDARGIAAAQRMLILLGYDLKADGLMGPATRKIILAFQKDHGMAEDGRLTISLVERLKIMTAELSRPGMATVAAGDSLIYSDGSVEVAASAKSVPWEPRKGSRALVAARPATADWPAEARAGLDWAVTHALDMPGPAVDWSSTGVNARFEIRTYAALTPREAALAGANASACHRFEMRSGDKRYPAIACPDAKGMWVIPRSKIRLARPASGLGQAALNQKR